MESIIQISLVYLTLGFVTHAVDGVQTFDMCANTTEEISNVESFEINYNMHHVTENSSNIHTCLCTLRAANDSTLVIRQKIYFPSASNHEESRNNFNFTIFHCGLETSCDNESISDNITIGISELLHITSVTYVVVQYATGGLRYMEAVVILSGYSNGLVLYLDCHHETRLVVPHYIQDDTTYEAPDDITQQANEPTSRPESDNDNLNSLIIPVVVGAASAMIIGAAVIAIICCMLKCQKSKIKYGTEVEDSVVCYTSNLWSDEHETVPPMPQGEASFNQTEGQMPVIPEYAMVNKPVKLKTTPKNDASDTATAYAAVDRSHTTKTKEPRVNKPCMDKKPDTTVCDVEYSDIIQAKENMDRNTQSTNFRQQTPDDSIHTHDNSTHADDDENRSKAVYLLENEVYEGLETVQAD